MRTFANIRIVLATFGVFLAAAVLITVASAQEELTYPNADLLVEREWVIEHSEDPDVILVDVREVSEYDNGHLPGAVYFDVGDVTAPENGVPDQVTDAETTSAALGAAGITPEKTVVIYYGSNTVLYAARLFWVLEYYGYPDVRLMNGTWSAGVVVNRREEPTEPEPVELTLTADDSRRVEGEWIFEHLDEATLRLIDARNPPEYDGISAASTGHIPGADNVTWSRNLDDGFFLEPEALAALYADLDLDADDQIVVYCSTGYRGAMLYYVLRLLGYENVALYDGSWAEWSQHPEWGIESNTS